MSLRTKIMGPLLLLGLAVVVLAGQLALAAWRDLDRVEAQRRAAGIAASLSEAAIALAVERGTMNGILANPAAATAERRAAARRAGTEGDAALASARLALEAETALAAAPGVGAAVAAVEAARTRVAALRLATEGASPPAPQAWFAATTAQIDATMSLRQALERGADGTIRLEARLEALRDALAEAAEQGGRERGLMNGIIAAGRVPTPEEARRIGGFAARSGLALDLASGLAEGLHSPVVAALGSARAAWAEHVEATRRAVLAAADAGQPYPLAAPAWFATTTRGIDAVIVAQRTASGELDRVFAAQQGAAGRGLLQSLGLLAVTLAAALAAAFWTSRRVTAPLAATVRALGQVAGGELDVPIPQRRARRQNGADEIDALLHAAEALRRVSIEARTADAAAAEARLEAERERTSAIRDIAERVDVELRAAVDDVAGRMQALSASAEAARGAVEAISASGAGVSSTAERSLEDAQSVAAATQQLSSSIAEISRQVRTTASAARDAAQRGTEGDATIRGLAETVGRIAGAAALIADIAARTNLLALNATIEAARAGDAGRGFAVVAGEVKQLAAQTTRATEEIAQQIGAVGAAADAAVGVVQRMARAVQEVDAAAAAIATAVEEQSETTQEIAGIIARAAEGSRGVAEGIGGVAQEAEQAVQRIGTMRGAADGTAEAVLRMRRDLGRILHGSAPELDRRAEPRVRPDPHLTARLGAGAGAEEAEVVDISSSGIALRSAMPVRAGSRLTIALPRLGIEGASVEVLEAAEGVMRGRLSLPDGAARAALGRWLASEARQAA